MNLNQFLVAETRRRAESLMEAAKRLPEDKLDWKPGPHSRSALDQLQECATVIDRFMPAIAEREIKWTPESFAAWREERKQITTLAEIEALLNESVEHLCQFIETEDPRHWTDPVKLPFPGVHDLAETTIYHAWNFGYHEGQINYIASLLAEE